MPLGGRLPYGGDIRQRLLQSRLQDRAARGAPVSAFPLYGTGRPNRLAPDLTAFGATAARSMNPGETTDFMTGSSAPGPRRPKYIRTGKGEGRRYPSDPRGKIHRTGKGEGRRYPSDSRRQERRQARRQERRQARRQERRQARRQERRQARRQDLRQARSSRPQQVHVSSVNESRPILRRPPQRTSTPRPRASSNRILVTNRGRPAPRRHAVVRNTYRLGPMGFRRAMGTSVGPGRVALHPKKSYLI